MEQGAANQVWCAVSPQLNGMGGVYCEDVEISRLVPDEDDKPMSIGGVKDMRGVRPYAVDPAAAARLWELSEALLASRPATVEEATCLTA